MVYGTLGSTSALFFNIYVSAGITSQGQSLISSAGLFFESFLGCNVKFMCLDDIITFIHNVEMERPIRKFNDRDILDRDITVSECFYRLMTNCAFEYIYMDDDREDGNRIEGVVYIPTKEDMNIVMDILYDLDQETINRLFYKNNLYTFMDNPAPTKAIIYLLQTLKEPMLNPNKAPKEIKVELDEFCSLLEEYVYYNQQYIDKTERYRGMTRTVNGHTDTDS